MFPPERHDTAEPIKMREVITTRINGYFITASWGPRAETPQDIAARFFRMIDGFKSINPIFRQWTYDRNNDLQAHRGDFADYIASKIERDDFGDINPNSGYWFGVRSPDDLASDRRFSIQCHAGKSIGVNFANDVIFRQDTWVQPTAEFNSYSIFRSALLAIVDAWIPETVEANCHWLVQRKTYDSHFRPAWMRYLCPALAQQAKPPASAIVEYLPNGGILLSATEQTFDVDNPQHVAAAEEIAAALESLRPG
jgi:hypothetical protein